MLEFAQSRADCRIVVCPDHPTFIKTMTHDGSPVPFAACGPGVPTDTSRVFSEKEAGDIGPYLERGWKLMYYASGREPWPRGTFTRKR